jgi:glycosyltransferase involved in cell wall biosynthesis
VTDARFLLMTSSDTGSAAMLKLRRLVASIERQGVRGDHIIVLRGDGSPELPQCRSVRLHPVMVPYESSLAWARNCAIGYARKHGLLDRADVVGFPDDDCEYLHGSLARVEEFVRTGEALACVPYAPEPDAVNRRRFPVHDMPMTPRVAMQTASCAGIFLPGWALRMIGDFDERYGLGAPFGASEDTDYALRALVLGLRCSYHGGAALVRHEYKPQRPAQYYLGNVAVLAKHARGGGTGYLLLRRLAHGALLTLARRISIRGYLRAVLTALRLLRVNVAEELPAPATRSVRTSGVVT